MNKLLLTLCCVLSTVFSYAYDFEVDGIYYHIISTDDLTVGVTSEKVSNGYAASFYSGDVVVPPTVTYANRTFKVTAIEYPAFYKSENLTSVSLPNTITEIAGSSFAYSGIKEITIPSSVANISSFSFGYCPNLKKVLIEDSTTPINFSDHNTNYVGIFRGCPLTNLYIGRNFSVDIPNTPYSPFGFHDISTNVNIEIGPYVTNICKNMFAYCKTMTSFTMHENITEIGESAFYECTNLRTINLPESLITISNNSFSGCQSLEKISFPSKITNIPTKSFYGCTSLQNLFFNDSITDIESSAFYNCSSLDSIDLPTKLSIIDCNAFANCSKLTKIKVHNRIPPIISDNAFSTVTYWTATLNVPNGTSTTYSNASGWNKFENISEIYFSDKSDPLAEIPQKSPSDQIWYTSLNEKIIQPYTSSEVSGISDYSASWGFGATIVNNEYINQMGIIKFDKEISQIGDYAFHNSKGDFDDLLSISIPKSVSILQEYCFYGCKNLKHIDIYGSPTIYTYAFYNCTSLESITCHSTEPPICNYSGTSQFSNVPTTMIVYVPKGAVDKYKQAAGWKNFATILSITDNVNIESISLSESSISMTEGDTKTLTVTISPIDATNKEVTWSSSNTSVATVSSTGLVTAVANGNAIITATANDGSGKSATCTVTVTEKQVLVSGISLSESSVTMTEGDTKTLTATITPTNATNQTVTWSSSNTSVATVSSAGLVTAVAKGSATITATANDGSNVSASCVITVCENSNNTFEVGGIKYVITSQSEKTVSVTYHGENYYNVMNAYTGNPTIPSQVDFNNITYTVTSIGDYAFYFSSITSIQLPNTIKAIGNHTFSSCKIKSIVIPNSVTSIGEDAFYCSSIETIEIPNSIASISRGTFEGCSNLKSLTLPNSVTSLATDAFRNCTALTSIDLPKSVKSIGAWCFCGCTNLATITLLESLTNLDSWVFQACDNLKNIYCYAENIPSTTSETFRLFDNLSIATLKVPASSVDLYKATSPWSGFGSIVAIEGTDITTDNGYNDYLESGTTSCSMTQMGGNVTKCIGYYIKNNGTESITLNKVIMRDATLLNEVSSSTDASLLGTLAAGETKSLEITIHQNIDLVYEWQYTYKGKTYTFKSWNYDVVKVSSIELSQTSVTIKKGETATLTATVKPDDAKQKDVSWTSSNQNVVSIDSKGNLVGIGVGTATITATATDGSGVSASCSVTVEESDTPSTGDYNSYLQGGSDGYSLSQIGSYVTKAVNFHITNNGTESIYITKLTCKKASDNSTAVSTSTDTSLLGTLESGATKSLSVTIHQNIDLVYEWEYTYKGNTCIFKSWESYPSAIDSVTSVEDNGVVAIYDASGKVISQMQKGLNILKMRDGSIKKVIKE